MPANVRHNALSHTTVHAASVLQAACVLTTWLPFGVEQLSRTPGMQTSGEAVLFAPRHTTMSIAVRSCLMDHRVPHIISALKWEARQIIGLALTSSLCHAQLKPDLDLAHDNYLQALFMRVLISDYTHNPHYPPVHSFLTQLEWHELTYLATGTDTTFCDRATRQSWDRYYRRHVLCCSPQACTCTNVAHDWPY
jgi:hypothetical protein